MNHAPHPPRWARWFLTQLHPNDTLEEPGPQSVCRPRTDRAGAVLPPYVRRRQRKQNEYQPLSNLQPTMLRNYFKIAWRSLLKSKLYSGINVIGLALGISCSLLIGLWVADELSYNRFLPDVSQIYFVRLNTTQQGEVSTNENTPGPLSDAILKDVPEVVSATKVAHWPQLLVKVGQKVAKERGYYATPGFFTVFQLPALAGNPVTALANPNQIIITRKLADTFFPAATHHYQRALGQPLQLDNSMVYTVGAVIDDLPMNSSLRFDWIANFKQFEQEWMNDWENNTFRTYVRLNPNVTAAKAEQTMSGLYPLYTKSDKPIVPVLQPVADVYLYGEYKNGKPVGGRITYVQIFSLVALFILLIACINFMNLATARSSIRMKEVGIRKVFGALRSSLIGQFLGESILMSVLATVFALLLVWLMLPTFNTLFQKQLTINLVEPTFWLLLAGLTVVTGFLAGSYPALFLSGLQPIRMLKGVLRVGSGPIVFRQALVVFQFCLSVFLIVAMLVAGRQINFLRTKNLGIDRDNVVAIPLEGELLLSRKEAFRQALLRLPSVASATTTNELPTNILSKSTTVKWPGKDPVLQPEISGNWVGPDFIKTMNISLLSGHDFRATHPPDSNSYIINESAAKLMGLKNPIGQEIDFWRGKGPIVGVMKDFHLQSLHQPIKPLILAFDNHTTSYVLIKVRAGQTGQALAELEQLTAQYNPTYPFNYQFLDEAYERLYRKEQQVKTLVNYFGGLAILISCMGLFALTAFTAQQRTKEIGVRKVLGASIVSLVVLFSKDFLALVLIALVVATPLAWWAVSQWLSTFQYHTPLSWWIFGITAVVAPLIALLTVSYQSIKAALMNPVKSLHSE